MGLTLPILFPIRSQFRPRFRRGKDYAHGNRKRVMRLPAMEFVRRLLLHVRPRAPTGRMPITEILPSRSTIGPQATWDASPEELRIAVETGVVPEPEAE
jgi:hypothetical protein